MRNKSFSVLLSFLTLFALVSSLACKGQRSRDIPASEFDGAAKHPAVLDGWWITLRDCLNNQFAGQYATALPLDSVVRHWIIAGKYDAPHCERKDGSIAGGCANVDTIRLAEHALQSWTIPVHEMGHTWQMTVQMDPKADGNSIHGPKFNKCTEDTKYSYETNRQSNGYASGRRATGNDARHIRQRGGNLAFRYGDYRRQSRNGRHLYGAFGV